MDKEKQQCVAAIMGLVVGDALGVPVEFVSRRMLKNNPVVTMKGYGTHQQPPGTWSDDSSMAIATMEWLGEIGTDKPDYKLLMDKFQKWVFNGDYTPYKEIFDIGIATRTAIINYGKGVAPLECGGKSEYDNGNGSLMRILPVALRYNKELSSNEIDGADIVFNVSALTHAHARSKIGCLIYSKIVADIMNNPNMAKFETVEKSLLACRKYLEAVYDMELKNEQKSYCRLWNLQEFCDLEEADIKSSGYVVHTLEAAIWCFLNTDNYKDCVLKAVNLGEDTDTVGAVAGGLAGLYYGYKEIPKEWIDVIPKKDWIEELALDLV